MPFVFDRDADCVSHVGLTKYIDAFLGKQRPEQEWKEMLQKAEEEDRERPPYPPVEKLTTTEFLVSKRLSDDDRAYYWKPDGDVHFTPEMTEWIGQLRAEFLEIKSAPERFINGQDLTKMLVELLADADKTLGLIAMFEETFYDILGHSSDPMRQAAVVLLQRLIERGKAELSSSNLDWWEKRFSPGRQRVRRYLAILGNLDLRKEIFGF